MGKAKWTVTREWLEKEMFKVLVNGIEGVELSEVKDGDLIEIYHYSNHFKWRKMNPKLNVKKHEKGIKKECKYLMLSFYSNLMRRQTSLPYHRFLYAWFYGCARAGYDISHLKDGELYVNPNDLIEETHAENLARRKGGAVNQYGVRKSERQ